MSLWKRLACIPEVEQRMKQYYDEKGLADIRVYFAQWIEEKIMSEPISPSNIELYKQIAVQFYEDLKQKLITLSNEHLLKFKLADICSQVARISAVDLYTHIRNGIQREIQLLDRMPQNPYLSMAGGVVGVGVGIGGGGGGAGGIGGGGGGTGTGTVGAVAGVTGVTGVGVGGVGVGGIAGVGSNIAPVGGGFGLLNVNANITPEFSKMHEYMQKLIVDIDTIRRSIQSFHSEFEQFQMYLNDFNTNKLLHSAQSVVDTERRMEEQYRILMEHKTRIINELRRVIVHYDKAQEIVINELKNWQRHQALAGNGEQFCDNLDEIQRWIELLVENVCKILSFINMMIQIHDASDLNDLRNHVRCAQEVLVLSAFIVEKQPPQVMKTNLRFAVAVRWLIGPQLAIHLNSPNVECMILSEAQAQRLYAQRGTMGEIANGTPASSGDILNNVSTMEYQQQSRVFSASFRNMQLKKIKRSEKKGTESVMDEKFALLFHTSIVTDYSIRVWTLSLPVVVIVHGNQEPQSWATITWDNAFSDILREPFQVPDKVSWSQLASALNTKFGSATGRRLTEDNLGFLYEKLFRSDVACGDHKDYITWAQFCKEPLPERSFTFWDWFFAIMKLTKDHLLGLWKADLIVGFVSKRRTTDEYLRNAPIGTFLLRFSDSELGGITVAFVNDQNQVLMLSPWTAKDLQIRGLADRIHDIERLCFAFPSRRPRDEAFGEFYTQRIEEQTRHDGYVASAIRAHVPAIEGGSMSNTPQHHMQSPTSQEMQMTNIEFSNDCVDDDFPIFLNDSDAIGRTELIEALFGYPEAV